MNNGWLHTRFQVNSYMVAKAVAYITVLPLQDLRTYACLYVFVVCMYVCMSAFWPVCMYACMYVCVCVYAWMYVRFFIDMYACRHVCMYVCMNECMYEVASVSGIDTIIGLFCTRDL